VAKARSEIGQYRQGACLATLVTGVAGFIGHHVAARLAARGEAVIGIDSLNDYYDPQLKRDRLAELRGLAGDAFVFHHLDFANHEALERALESTAVDRIVHLGAQAGVRHSLERPREYVRANLAGHLNILELARQRGVRHTVYASSSSVYGGNRTLPFRVEDRVEHPISLYAATKRSDELMSETYAHLYRIPLTGLRFFTVYGPWGRPDMAMWIFTGKILAGETIQLFNHGQMRRDFTYIDDIVAGVVAAHDSPPSGGGGTDTGGSSAPHRIYNIGNNRAEELTRLVELIERACGRKAEIELLPIQPGDVYETFADIDPISRDLGYRPTTDIDEGIPRFVDWFRNYRR
jgi:UDP-glucuronate 4-epimerase